MTAARVARASVSVAAVATLLAGCGSNGTTGLRGSGPPIVIGFASNRPPATNGGYDQYFYDAASGRPAYMPPNLDTYYDEPDGGFSADGRWYAFTSTRLLTGTLARTFLYDVRNATVTPLLTPAAYPGAQNPALSGDGRYLAFHYQTGGNLFDVTIGFMDAFADSAIPVPSLHLDPAGEFDPELSGDGRLIAFSSNRDQTGGRTSLGIYLYSVPGDSLVPLPGLNTPYDETGVGISADGRYIAFHSYRPGSVGLFDVYVYDRQSASLLPMPGANTALSELNPALSPDGRYVAYQSENDGAGDLRLYDLVLQKRVAVPGLNDAYYLDRFPTVANRP